MVRTVNLKRREARRGHILQAAVACFIRRGFHQTSMQEICAEAGMSAGNLYRYFAGKEAIIEAIAEEERRENAVLFEKLFGARDLLGGLIELLEASLRRAADPDYERISLEVAAEASRNPRVAAMFARNEAEAKEAFVRILRVAAERGQVDPDLDFASVASLLIALADSAIGRMTLDPDFEPAALAPTMRALVTRFLRPPNGSDAL